MSFELFRTFRFRLNSIGWKGRTRTDERTGMQRLMRLPMGGRHNSPGKQGKVRELDIGQGNGKSQGKL